MTLDRLARAGKSLDSIAGTMSRWGRWVGMVMMVAIIILVTVDVIMRGAFSKPLLGAYELVQYFMVPLVFFALFYTTQEKGHIAVSVMTERLKPRAKTVIYIFGYVVSLVLFVLITWQSVMYGLRLFNSGEESLALGIPSYPFAFVVALGTAFTCLVLLANLIDTIAGIGEQ